MIKDNVLVKYPLIMQGFSYLNSRFALYAKTYQFIMRNFDEEYLTFSEEILSVLHKKYRAVGDFERALQAFIRFSIEFLVLQSKLNKERHYLYSSFEEVNKAVYQDRGMKDYYLDGQLLSQIFWPNHYKMVQYFKELRSSVLPSAIILDVPAGGGIYSYTIAKYFSYKKFLSVDISSYSVAYTKDLLRYTNLETHNLSVEVRDVYTMKDQNAYDFISCGELLEHLECPEDLLSQFLCMLKDDGILFLTTAIWAANIDHIYLFRNVKEVREMIERFFSIKSELILPVSLEDFQEDMHEVPINYACILQKKTI